MPAKKKQTRLKKLVAALSPNSPLKKFLVFILVFAAIGGGYFLYRSHALSTPPTSLTKMINVYPTNQKIGVTCLNTALPSGSGNLAYNCVMFSVGATGLITPGTWSPVTKQWQASHSSYGVGKYPNGTYYTRWCKDVTNGYFVGVGTAISSSGSLAFGYVYVWYGKWVAKPAVLNINTAQCSTSGDWTVPVPVYK